MMRPPTVDPDAQPPPARKRTQMLALVGVAVLVIGGAVGAMVMVSSSGNGTATATVASPTTRPVAVDAAVTPAAGSASADTGSAVVAQADAGIVDAAAATVVDAAVVAGAASPPVQKARPATMTQKVVAQHLAAAREAQASHSSIAELAHAQEALKLDPSNLSARFYMGDALLASGDLDHGCQILRNIKKFALAAQRMQLAGCPP